MLVFPTFNETYNSKIVVSW